ncbi:MAG: hypothetical protein AAGI01_10620, partial [Myxococcota bacterium]
MMSCTTKRSSWLTVLLFGACVGSASAQELRPDRSPPSAPAAPKRVEYDLEAGRLSVKEDGVEVGSVLLRCAKPKRVLRVTGRRVFIACARALQPVGLMNRRAPSAGEPIELAGEPRALTVIDKKMWVWVERTSVRVESLDVLAAEASSSQVNGYIPFAGEVTPARDDASSQPDETDEVAGRVVSVRGREVTTNLGTDVGLELGDSLEFYLVEAAGGGMTRERIVLSATVEAITASRSEVFLGVNQELPQGARVRRTELAGQQLGVRVPRPSGTTELGVHVRPFFALGSLGGGALVDAHGTHTFKRLAAVALRVTPVGFGATSDGSAGAFAASLTGSFDSTYVAMGLGVGVLGAPDAQAFHIVQEVRVGARDGLMAHGHVMFHLQDAAFAFESLRIEAQLPVFVLFEDTWVLLRGGGGRLLRYGFGEIGVRRLIRGNGLDGTTFVSAT